MTWHPSIRLDRLDRTIAAAIALLVVTLVVAALPGVIVRVTAPGLDVVFDTVSCLVALAVAGLAWARYRDRGQWVVLCEAAAFLVLALASAIATVMALQTLDAAPGVPAVPFSEASLDVAVVARIVAASVLVAGGARSVRWPPVGRPVLLAVAPAAMVFGLALLLAVPGVTVLPPLVAAAGTSAPGGTSLALPVATPANVMLQVAGAALFAVAAVLARRRARGAGGVSNRYLAAGLVVAAFAQLHLTFFPSAYAGVMTSGDLLYLVFDVILLLGIEAETSAYLASLRLANIDLQRLREAEVERAAIEERARLSRELHDGLAQDLWLAKLKIGRLTTMPELKPEARVLCGELDEAIDAGLADARQAVMALRPVGEAGTPFSELMARVVDEFSDRFGIRTQLDAADDIPPLGTRTEAELLRIVGEALSNARRHADATLIRIRAGVVDGRLALSIRDNGRGFDPADAGSSGIGLVGMRERATLIGGRLTIISEPSDGTTVAVDVPVAAVATIQVAATS